MAQIYSDAFFRIGQTHDVCEDYAASGAVAGGDAVVAAVSDGCSSEDNTNVGALALARSAVQLLSAVPDVPPAALVRLLAHDALRATRTLGVGDKAAYATLMAVATAGDLGWIVRCWGDGIVGFRYGSDQTYGPDQATVVKVIEWPNEQPYYPIYSLSDLNPDLRPTVKTLVFPADEREPYEEEYVSELEGVVYCPPGHTHEGIDQMFVGSDGWSSFVHKNSRAPIDILEVLGRILPLKCSGPSFVRRQLRGSLTRFPDDWSHGDDLSLAGILRVKDSR